MLTVDDVPALLTTIALDDPALFPERLVSILVDALPIEAAAIYLSTTSGSRLRLRARTPGFDVGPTPELDDGTSIGDAVFAGAADEAWYLAPTGDIVIKLDVGRRSSTNYRGPSSAGQPIGALVLRVDQASVAQATAALSRFTPIVGPLYLSALDRRAMELRRSVVQRVAYRRDIGSMAHNYLTIVKQELCFEGAALWVFDPRRNLLYRRRALSPKTQRSPGALPTLRLDADSLVAQCFGDARTIWRDGILSGSGPEVDLAHSEPLDNWAAIPVRLSADARVGGKRPPAAGVLELVNHFAEVDGHRHKTQLTWEDQYLLDFTCELLSVLIFQVLRSQDHETEYERKLHGAKTALLAARGRIQVLADYNLEQYLPPRAKYYIPNAIEWLQDLESQINRDEFVNRVSSQLETVSLYGDVLAKLEIMLARVNSLDPDDEPLRLNGLDELARTYHSIPHVIGNKPALDCVFRNLVDNSRKYCRPARGISREASIRVSVSEDGANVVVLFSDNGRPVPQAERESIFEDGFRGDVASGIQPEGLGIGLFDCRRLMDQMGGSISVDPSDDGVTFRLELPVAPRRDRA